MDLYRFPITRFLCFNPHSSILSRTSERDFPDSVNLYSTVTGTESRRPLGLLVIGGMLFSTFLTLVIVPVVYTFLSRFIKTKEEAKQLNEAREAAIEHEPVIVGK